MNQFSRAYKSPQAGKMLSSPTPISTTPVNSERPAKLSENEAMSMFHVH